YMHVHYWPGEIVSLGGLKNKVVSAKLLATGKEVKFEQETFRVRFTGLPSKAPDDPVTTIAIECDGEPVQDTNWVRKDRPRLRVYPHPLDRERDLGSDCLRRSLWLLCRGSWFP